MKPRLKSRYYALKPKEWVRPRARDYRLACCGCGLSHLHDFRVKGGRVEFRVKYDNRATAALRREMRKRGQPFPS